MGQIFHRNMNARVRRGLLGAGLFLAALVALLPALERAPWLTGLGRSPAQPVAFSHMRHVREVGVNCQYCHGSVELSSNAGIPPTKTCVNCHAYLKSSPQLLEPVRLSWLNGTPLVWKRVYNLPGYVYFSHDIHVRKGVGCASCHGRVDRMQRMEARSSLQMEWCLDCHRNPAPHLRPTAEIYNMDWQGPNTAKPVWCAANVDKNSTSPVECLTAAPAQDGREYHEFTSQEELGRFLFDHYRIRSAADLSSCEVCHR
jgi:hypothetical protein